MFRALADFMEFCYIMRRAVIDEHDLMEAEKALQSFKHHCLVFQHTGVRPGRFSLPQMHALQHYLQHVHKFTTPNGLCSSITESKHIKAVKEPWHQSSRFNALQQMLLTNQHLDKLSASHTDFNAQGVLEGTCLSAALLHDPELLSDPQEDALEHQSHGKIQLEDPFVNIHDQGPADVLRALCDIRLAWSYGM